MPEAEQSLASLPPEVIVAIATAANRHALVPPEKMAGLGRWLEEEWGKAVRRARTHPLKRPDVERLENAYRKFCAVIDSLQDRTLPPPRIPMSNGKTAWEDWQETYEQFGHIRGRRESSDWLLIGALLALYETLVGKPASAAQATGPTMRFLKSALNELAAYAPDDSRSNFEPPNAETLKQQLPSLKRLSLWHAKRRLEKIMEITGQ